MKTTALNKFVASPRHVARSSDPRADLVGIVDLALGGLVLMSNPAEAFLFLGYLVGISLILRGLWSLMFTAGLHDAARARAQATE